MAGKRMKLRMDMPLFSTIPVDRRTLYSWSFAIESEDRLMEALAAAMKEASKEPLTLNWLDGRAIGSIVQLADEIDKFGTLTIHTKWASQFGINGTTERRLLEMEVNDVAQVEIDSGAWVMMILGTYRAINCKLTGPIVGLNFNITVAGIVATCLRLGVPVEFEAE